MTMEPSVKLLEDDLELSATLSSLSLDVSGDLFERPELVSTLFCPELLTFQ